MSNRVRHKILLLSLTAWLCVGLSACSLSGSKSFDPGPRLGEGREWRNAALVTDFNQDGRQDIVATHRRPITENSLHIWLGDTEHGFVATKQQWSSPGYSGIAIADIDGDSKLDVVAASHFQRVHTFLQDSLDAPFRESMMKTDDGYVCSELIDINNDGKLELVLLGNERAGVQIYSGNSKGTWKLKTQLMKGRIGRDMKVVDINSDGRLDIVASLSRGKTMVILEQQEDNSWKETELTDFYSATREFKSFDIQDINGDGHLDFALNGGATKDGTDSGPDVYLADGQGAWKPSLKGLKVLKNPTPGLVTGDFNHDGFVDLVVGGNRTGQIDESGYGLFLFAGNGGDKWRLISNSGLPSKGLARPHAITLGDMNDDKAQDLVVTHGAPVEGSGYVSVWYGKPAES